MRETNVNHPIPPQIAQLKAILEEEIALHAGLREDLTAEAAKDGSLDSSEFLALQQRKYTRAHQIGGLEEKRMEAVRALAAHWQMPEAKLSLQEISHRVDGATGAELLMYRDSLLALIEEIRHLAKETGGNAAARLKAIDATLAVIGEAARLHPTYSQGGKVRQRPPTFKQTSA